MNQLIEFLLAPLFYDALEAWWLRLAFSIGLGGSFVTLLIGAVVLRLTEQRRPVQLFTEINKWG